MANPREYALPGNQDPATPWPSSLVLLSGIAAATTRLRLVAGAVIPPLRHPLLLARELGSLDLLVRGAARRASDRQLAPRGVRGARRALRARAATCWTSTSPPGRCSGATRPRPSRARTTASPTSTSSRRRYRPGGPVLWFGGSSVHDRLLRRLVRYGDGFNPLGSPTRGRARAAARRARRGGPRARLARAGRRHPRHVPRRRAASPTFRGPSSRSRGQLERGYTSICFKPSQYTDELEAVGPLCREIVRRVARAPVSAVWPTTPPTAARARGVRRRRAAAVLARRPRAARSRARR